MRFARAIIYAAVALLSFLIGWILSPGPYRRVFVTTRPLQIGGAHGEVLGQLPTGTTVISKLPLDGSADVEWWGFVAVDVGTMPEARQVVRERGALTRTSYVGDMLNVIYPPTDTRPISNSNTTR